MFESKKVKVFFIGAGLIILIKFAGYFLRIPDCVTDKTADLITGLTLGYLTGQSFADGMSRKYQNDSQRKNNPE